MDFGTITNDGTDTAGEPANTLEVSFEAQVNNGIVTGTEYFVAAGSVYTFNSQDKVWVGQHTVTAVDFNVVSVVVVVVVVIVVVVYSL